MEKGAGFMADSGIDRIDKLLAGTAGPITSEDAPADAVGAVQDLLRGHGYKTAGLRVPGYQKFGPGTQKAVKAFRKAQGLKEEPIVDRQTLRKLVDLPATNPIISRPYLTLVLNKQYSGFGKLVSLVAIVEGAGQFGALCLNTDRAGLSVGIIQWAQKPKRLAELVEQWWDAKAKEVIRPLLGYAPTADAEFKKLTDHLKKPRGGTNEEGKTTDPAFDLIADPWKTRFKNACLNRRLQELQVDAAVAAFTASHQLIKTNMPKFFSELGVAFTIDLGTSSETAGRRRSTTM